METDPSEELSLYHNTPCKEDSVDEQIRIKTEEDDEHSVLYQDYQCVNCNSNIDGFRYACVQCAAELCAACEAARAHRTHYVLRVPQDTPHNEFVMVMQCVRQQVALLLDPLLESVNVCDSNIKIEVKEEVSLDNATETEGPLEAHCPSTQDHSELTDDHMNIGDIGAEAGHHSAGDDCDDESLEPATKIKIEVQEPKIKSSVVAEASERNKNTQRSVGRSCMLCNDTLPPRERSHQIIALRTDNERQRNTRNIILERLTPLEVRASHFICHPCWQEVDRNAATVSSSRPSTSSSGSIWNPLRCCACGIDMLRMKRHVLNESLLARVKKRVAPKQVTANDYICDLCHVQYSNPDNSTLSSQEELSLGHRPVFKQSPLDIQADSTITPQNGGKKKSPVIIKVKSLTPARVMKLEDINKQLLLNKSSSKQLERKTPNILQRNFKNCKKMEYLKLRLLEDVEGAMTSGSPLEGVAPTSSFSMGGVQPAPSSYSRE